MMGDSVLWGDGFRFLILIFGSGALALSAWIAFEYALAWRRMKRAGTRTEGLLPRHVAGIGLSYAILVVVVIAEHTNNEDPVTWREPADLVALMIGLWALRDMTKYQRYRKVRLPREAPRPTDH